MRACIKCHGAQKPKAKLRLDNLERRFRKGSENGKVVEPGNSAKRRDDSSTSRTLGDEG